jgi:chromosome segregation ATPase
MTTTNDRLDRVERLIEQLAEENVRSRQRHDEEMIELRQLQASNARAIEANSTGIAENRATIATVGQRVDQVTQQVSELSGGVDACFRTVESMSRVMESLETTQIEMRQQHGQQMDRLGNILELMLTRYPTPPQE